jgi:hypothetical protein
VLADKFFNERHDFVGAFAIRSPVGSSHKRKVGSETTARAMVTRCSLPAGKLPGKMLQLRSARPTTEARSHVFAALGLLIAW